MKKFALVGFIGLALAGCSNVNRTVPVFVVEERPFPDYRYENPRMVVPQDRMYLPEPRYHEHEARPVPMPTPRPYSLDQRRETVRCNTHPTPGCVR